MNSTPDPVKTIMVTGCAGFVGFHLVKKFLAHGYAVVGIDNINDYYDTRLKTDRLHELGIDLPTVSGRVEYASSRYPAFSFYRMDIADPLFVHDTAWTGKFELVVHLAAQAGVRYSLINPDSYIRNNIVGFHHILEMCRLQGIKRLLFASSSSVYGNNNSIPFSETDMVDHPESLYAATKKSNELTAYCYSQLYGIATVGLRFFTVYGEWGRPDMAYYSFLQKIYAEKEIEVYNNGNLERDFTYIDDIIEGIYNIAVHDKRERYDIYNIGNSSPVKLMEFISILEEHTGRQAKKIMKPMQPGDVLRTYADTRKIESVHGFKPSTDLRTGLKKFVEWYKRYYRIDD